MDRWGRYEWKGPWGDGTKEWDENPMVKMRLRPKGEDDGTFWMPFDALVTGEAGFTKIDFCDRTTKRDLTLKAKEGLGVCGVVWGALSGFAKYVFLCRGLTTIYFGALSSKQTKSSKRGCQKCMDIGKKDVSDPSSVQVDIDRKVMKYANEP